MAAASARVATSRCSLTASRSVEGRLEQTVPFVFSADDACDVGKNGGSPVSSDYGPSGNDFSGEVNWVQIDLARDDHDHINIGGSAFPRSGGAPVQHVTGVRAADGGAESGNRRL